MKWLEFSITVPPEFVEPVSNLFHRYGRATVIEEQATTGTVTLYTYLSAVSKLNRAKLEIGIRLVSALGVDDELAVRELEKADWEEAWKAYFTLLRIGKTLAIKPSWIDYAAGPDEVVVELDPGMAFGTGHHPTTRLCLELLEREVRPGMAVLDLGTGSGILAIAASKLGASRVVALDTDSIAIKVCRENVRKNGLGGAIRMAVGTLPHARAPRDSFGLALANITSKAIIAKALNLGEVLVPGGVLIASGILSEQRGNVEQAVVDAGFSLVHTSTVDDWVALVATRER